MSTANRIATGRRAWARWTTAIVGGLSLAGAANAHHSFSVFDMTTEKTIEGDIVEFQWTNPHTWTWVNVKSVDGTVTRWGLEGMSPNLPRPPRLVEEHVQARRSREDDHRAAEERRAGRHADARYAGQRHGGRELRSAAGRRSRSTAGVGHRPGASTGVARRESIPGCYSPIDWEVTRPCPWRAVCPTRPSRRDAERAPSARGLAPP